MVLTVRDCTGNHENVMNIAEGPVTVGQLKAAVGHAINDVEAEDLIVVHQTKRIVPDAARLFTPSEVERYEELSCCAKRPNTVASEAIDIIVVGMGDRTSHMLDLELDNTILDVKHAIHFLFGIKTSRQSISFGSQLLEGEQVLRNCRVLKNFRLKVVVVTPPGPSIQLKLYHRGVGTTTTVEVHPDDTIDSVIGEFMLQHLDFYDLWNSTWLENEEEILDEVRTVKSYEIVHGQVLDLCQYTPS